MAWKPIRAGRDHIQQYGKQPAVDAVAELIWNSLDAEADQVDVQMETASIGVADSTLTYVTRIVVSDNGHGITPDLAETAFLSLGDSWKKTLNGRTVNNKRALHGNMGRGRFFVYALGSRVTWSSFSLVDGKPTVVEIRGQGNLCPHQRPAGTAPVPARRVAAREHRPAAVRRGPLGRRGRVLRPPLPHRLDRTGPQERQVRDPRVRRALHAVRR
ncbi:ATP-binding protein [Kibdelosporangium phytohabitans]|uniref:ATP-binding protein n=1 Tax=Kibdelosporangium phytohabitans TaxID=860235 RepID=UPI001CEF2D97